MVEKWQDHHNAAYNLSKIAKNLSLLQEHYLEDPCRECCGKHLQLIAGYAEEGLGLDDGLTFKDFLIGSAQLADKHLNIILECSVKEHGTCQLVDYKDMVELAKEIRTLRREINMAVFGFAADLLYEGEGGDHHEHSHLGNAHGHEEPHEEPLSVELTEDGLEEFTHYLELRPDVLASEEHTIGINPLAHPDRYFEAELQELEHADVLQMVKRKGGLMDKNAVERWEREETAAR